MLTKQRNQLTQKAIIYCAGHLLVISSYKYFVVDYMPFYISLILDKHN